MRTPAELYKYHCRNLRQVTVGMERVARTMRRSIACDDSLTTDSLLRLYALMLGTWAECRLKKLLYEPGGFDESSRSGIRALPSQYERWARTVETAFRIRFSLPRAPLNGSTIPFAAAARYSECLALLEKQIKPVIELRNKFAHGQWAYLLTNDESDVNTVQMAAFRGENFMTLQFKRDLVEHISSLVNDLVVSVAFDRDFDTHYKLIAFTKMRLERQDYPDYEKRLRERHARGRVRQRAT